MVEISLPRDFLCPISLDMMTEPVTLSTGQTYDRRSIDEWFRKGHNRCPSTMQVVNTSEGFSPNHAIQRMIQRWCASNDYGYKLLVKVPASVPTKLKENVAVSSRKVKDMLRAVAQGGNDRYANLGKLRALAQTTFGQETKQIEWDAEAVPVLANCAFSPENLSKDLRSSEEALACLALLPLQNIQEVVKVGPRQLTTISWLLNKGSLEARVNAALVLAKVSQGSDKTRIAVGGTAGVFEGLVQLLRDTLYPKAVDAGLKSALAIISGEERNAVKAVEAGMVFAAAELLPASERSGRERLLMRLLQILCACSEGREVAAAHALVIPSLARIIAQRDGGSLESAVSCLSTICQISKLYVDDTAGQAGIINNLTCVVESNDSKIGQATKQRAADLLRQLKNRMKQCDRRR